MTPAEALGAFAGVALLVTLTPGPDTLLVLRAALAGGRRAAWATACGIALGCLCWGAASALGLTVLLRGQPLLYDAVRLLGLAYLLWLGLTLLLRRPQPADGTALGAGGFVQGLVTNLLNSKVGLFYLALTSQFLPAGVSPFAWLLLLAAVHAAMGLAWFAVLIRLTDRAARRFAVPLPWLNRMAGLLLLAAAGYGAVRHAP